MELVKMESGKAVCSSLDIAEKFEKAHSVIIRKIELLDCSSDFRLNNIVESEFVGSKNRRFKCYTLTRDGFSMVAMGLTGPKVTKWKEDYISAFNKMESKLISLATGLNCIESVSDEVKRITSDESLTDGQKLDLVSLQNEKARMYASQAGKALCGYKKMKAEITEDENDLKERVQMVFEI